MHPKGFEDNVINLIVQSIYVPENRTQGQG